MHTGRVVITTVNFIAGEHMRVPSVAWQTRAEPIPVLCVYRIRSSPEAVRWLLAEVALGVPGTRTNSGGSDYNWRIRRSVAHVGKCWRRVLHQCSRH